MSSQSRHHSGSTILTCSQSYEKPFIFQSLILVCSNYSDYSVWFSYLRIDKVIGTNDSCTQFFRHLPRQQTVNGSISGAPRSPVDEHHQRRRHTFGPVHVWRVVQVQLVASAAKCDALCVQTDKSVNFNTMLRCYITHFEGTTSKAETRIKVGFFFLLLVNTPSHSACGFPHSCTMTSTESKVAHIAGI